MPVVFSDSPVWLPSASRDMHILIHHLLPTGLPAVHVYTGNVCWCAVKDQHQQENKRTVLHDVQYKLQRICCLSTWSVWPITERHLRSHDFSFLRFVNQTKWDVAAMYHLCDDLDQETDIKVWTRPNKMIFASMSPCMLLALMRQTVS